MGKKEKNKPASGLLDDDDDAGGGDLSIKINESFAKRFEVREQGGPEARLLGCRRRRWPAPALPPPHAPLRCDLVRFAAASLHL